MKEYNPKARCPKCGHAEVVSQYHDEDYWTQTYHSVCPHEEHICRYCYEKRWPRGKPIKVLKLNQAQIKAIQKPEVIDD